MEKVIVLVDSDGVLADLVLKWCAAYNEQWDDNLPVEEFVKDFGSVHKQVKPECGEKVYDIMKAPGFFSDLETMLDARGRFKELCSDSRLDVYVVSSYSACGEIAKGKAEWFPKVFPFFDPEKIFLCKHKELVYGDILIDDSEENLNKWVEHQVARGNENCCAIAFAAPHNVGVDENDNVDIRANNWEEVLDYLENIVL